MAPGRDAWQRRVARTRQRVGPRCLLLSLLDLARQDTVITHHSAAHSILVCVVTNETRKIRARVRSAQHHRSTFKIENADMHRTATLCMGSIDGWLGGWTGRRASAASCPLFSPLCGKESNRGVEMEYKSCLPWSRTACLLLESPRPTTAPARTQMRVARRISYIMHRAALGRGVCTLQCAYVLYAVCGTYPY